MVRLVILLLYCMVCMFVYRYFLCSYDCFPASASLFLFFSLFSLFLPPSLSGSIPPLAHSLAPPIFLISQSRLLTIYLIRYSPFLSQLMRVLNVSFQKYFTKAMDDNRKRVTRLTRGKKISSREDKYKKK